MKVLSRSVSSSNLRRRRTELVVVPVRILLHTLKAYKKRSKNELAPAIFHTQQLTPPVI